MSAGIPADHAGNLGRRRPLHLENTPDREAQRCPRPSDPGKLPRAARHHLRGCRDGRRAGRTRVGGSTTLNSRNGNLPTHQTRSRTTSCQAFMFARTRGLTTLRLGTATLGAPRSIRSETRSRAGSDGQDSGAKKDRPRAPLAKRTAGRPRNSSIQERDPVWTQTATRARGGRGRPGAQVCVARCHGRRLRHLCLCPDQGEPARGVGILDRRRRTFGRADREMARVARSARPARLGAFPDDIRQRAGRSQRVARQRLCSGRVPRDLVWHRGARCHPRGGAHPANEAMQLMPRMAVVVVAAAALVAGCDDEADRNSPKPRNVDSGTHEAKTRSSPAEKPRAVGESQRRPRRTKRTVIHTDGGGTVILPSAPGRTWTTPGAGCVARGTTSAPPATGHPGRGCRRRDADSLPVPHLALRMSASLPGSHGRMVGRRRRADEHHAPNLEAEGRDPTHPPGQQRHAARHSRRQWDHHHRPTRRSVFGTSTMSSPDVGEPTA